MSLHLCKTFSRLAISSWNKSPIILKLSMYISLQACKRSHKILSTTLWNVVSSLYRLLWFIICEHFTLLTTFLTCGKKNYSHIDTCTSILGIWWLWCGINNCMSLSLIIWMLLATMVYVGSLCFLNCYRDLYEVDFIVRLIQGSS